MNTATARWLDWRFGLVTLAALVTMVVTASMGRWQLSRATQKEALQAAIDARVAEPPLSLRDFLSQVRALPAQDRKTLLQGQKTTAADGLLYRRVQLQGRWLPQATVYLDNRQMHGRPGFYVVSPLQMDAPGAPVVMVQRGWLLRDFQDRTKVADYQTSEANVQLVGRIASAPARLYDFEAPGEGAGSSRIRQNLNLAMYASEKDLPLLPLMVVQTEGESDGLQRDWPAVDNGVDKHYGYAFQWFGLCSLVAILYVWFQIVRRFLRPSRATRA